MSYGLPQEANATSNALGQDLVGIGATAKDLARNNRCWMWRSGNRPLFARLELQYLCNTLGTALTGDPYPALRNPSDQATIKPNYGVA